MPHHFVEEKRFKKRDFFVPQHFQIAGKKTVQKTWVFCAASFWRKKMVQKTWVFHATLQLAEKKRFKKREFFMPHHLAHLFFGQKISNFLISPTKVRHRKNALLLKWAIRTLKRPLVLSLLRILLLLLLFKFEVNSLCCLELYYEFW